MDSWKEDLAMLEKMLESLAETATQVGLRLLYALVILVVGLKLSSFLVRFVSKGKGFEKLDQSVQSFFKSFLNILLKVMVVISAAVVLGIPTTSFITMLASCGVAIGLALQGALGNFAGGLMILVFKPFKAGDYIETQSYSGTVRSVSVFYTTLITLDNKVITLPNGTLTNSAVVNLTSEPMRRVDLIFSVSYDSDIAAVKQLLLQLAAEHPFVLQEPAAFAGLAKQDDSALQFQLRVWCLTEHYWEVYHDLNEQVKTAFDEHNIAIPYPQMDVHIH